jgi:hypothetical protein
MNNHAEAHARDMDQVRVFEIFEEECQLQERIASDQVRVAQLKAQRQAIVDKWHKVREDVCTA